jgi:hypothetical protein
MTASGVRDETDVGVYYPGFAHPRRLRRSAAASVMAARSGPGRRLGDRDGSNRGRAVIHLIADRLNLGGARWGLDGAEAILALRAVISDGDFEEYWRFHLAREHQRLYPGTTQGQYALGA